MRIAILGGGAWGSALAVSLCAAHDVRLWTRNARDCETLSRLRTSTYLPGISLPAAIAIEGDLGAALSDREIAIVATPTEGLRQTAKAVAARRPGLSLLWACKGFEEATRLLPHQVVAQVFSTTPHAGALSGPSFALEVAQGLPTALVLASSDGTFAATTASALNSSRLRLYSSTDVVGVELGGAVKNVIAIAAGIADGLALGRNARAALVTRGLAEIVRLGVALGGQAETFMGLAGLGDLVLTCTGSLSRNREVGLRLARGERLPEILAALGHVAEGVRSARSVRDIAREHGAEMPIADAVCSVLFDGRDPADMVRQLLAREPRPE